MEAWLINFGTLLVGVGVIFIWIWFMRRRYTNMFAPSKSAPNGKLVAEYWPPQGERYLQVLPIEENGIEVKSPKGHSCPRYFFNKNSVGSIRYPVDTLFRWLGISVKAPIVSWPENNPEPVNPYETGIPVVTATMIDALRDNDFAAFAMAASREIQELERELAKALASRIKPMYVYVLLVMGVILSGLAAIMAFQAFDIASYIKSAWGL